MAMFVRLLLIAGYDSTSSFILAWMVEIARRPELKAALREEQDGIFCDGANLFKSLHDGTPLLDRTLLEVGRMYPPAPGISICCCSSNSSSNTCTCS